jgi:Lar family restriction alleviation protein
MNLAECPTRDLRTAEPFRSLFPHSDRMAETIAAAMVRHGYDPAFPIITWNGVVVDGHTRLAAAKAAKLRTVFYVDRPFDNESEALVYAIKCQTNRRNLTDAEILRCMQELDKRRTRSEAGAIARQAQLGEAQGCATPTPDGKSSAATAATLGISQRKVEQARTVLDHAPEPVKAAVQSGDLSINAAYNATQEARRESEPAKPPPVKRGSDYGAKACPHCGNDDVVDDHNSRSSAFYVKCDRCGLAGPTGQTAAEAASHWNGLHGPGRRAAA